MVVSCGDKVVMTVGLFGIVGIFVIDFIKMLVKAVVLPLWI